MPVLCSASTEPIDAVQATILTDIAGHLLRKGQAKHTCALCSCELEKTEKAVMYDREILSGLKSYTGQDDTDVGSLLKHAQAFHDVAVRAHEVVQGLSPSIFGRSGLASGRSCASTCARQKRPRAWPAHCVTATA